MSKQLTLNTALDYLDKIIENKIDINFCEFVKGNEIKNFRFRDYNQVEISASQSVGTAGIVVGEIVHLALKNDKFSLALKHFDLRNKAEFDYESKLYIWITQNIIIPNLSPNFIASFGYAECGDKDENGRIKKGVGIIINEAAQNCAYFGVQQICPVNSLTFMKGDKEVLEQCLLQAIIAIDLMYKMGITHGDLHSSNVLVATLPQPVILYYKVGERTYKLTTKYIVKLFDWDRGYAEALGTNPNIDDLYNFTFLNTNANKPIYDLYTLLCTVFDKPSRAEGSEILETLANVYKFGDSARGLAYKENRKIFEINKTQAMQLQVYKPLFSVVINREEQKEYLESPARTPLKILVYFLGGAQAREALGSVVVPENVYKAMLGFYMDGKKYKIVYYNGFSCRLTTESLFLPAPSEILSGDVFEKYFLPTGETVPDNYKYFYTTPDIKKPLRLTLNPGRPYVRGENVMQLYPDGTQVNEAVDDLIVKDDEDDDEIDINRKKVKVMAEDEIDFLLPDNQVPSPIKPSKPVFDFENF